MIGLPKPIKRTDAEQRVERLTKAWARKDRWRAKAIANAKGKPRPKVRGRNEKRIARKAKAYRTVLASDFHKRLRYEAFLRSRGYCECEQCVGWRKRNTVDWVVFPDEVAKPTWGTVEWYERELAHSTIPVWFTNKGGESHRRFRSTDGELHHRDYAMFATENPAEIEHVLWVHKVCHQRLEAKHSTRRRFLTGK